MFEACFYLLLTPCQHVFSSKDCFEVCHPPFGPLGLLLPSPRLSTDKYSGVCCLLCIGGLLLKPCLATHCDAWAAHDMQRSLTTQPIWRSNHLDLKKNHSFGPGRLCLQALCLAQHGFPAKAAVLCSSWATSTIICPGRQPRPLRFQPCY